MGFFPQGISSTNIIPMNPHYVQLANVQLKLTNIYYSAHVILIGRLTSTMNWTGFLFNPTLIKRYRLDVPLQLVDVCKMIPHRQLCKDLEQRLSCEVKLFVLAIHSHN